MARIKFGQDGGPTIITTRNYLKVVRSDPGINGELGGSHGRVDPKEWEKLGNDMPSVSEASKRVLKKTFIRRWRPIDLGI